MKRKENLQFNMRTLFPLQIIAMCLHANSVIDDSIFTFMGVSFK